ncbi:MAG: single-stranded DNA-binding protein [Gammaproteobacteria bacterium]|nr:single-stranded DNA-binding protein [Gammaproteobacteria bacterium]
MSGVNKAIIIGNCGADPVLKYTARGSPICEVSVATSTDWKDANTGEKKQAAEWHKVVFFNNLADVVGKYVRKGSKIYVEGRIQTQKWTDKNGVDRYTTSIIGGSMQMLDSRSEINEEKQTESPCMANVQQDIPDDGIPF